MKKSEFIPAEIFFLIKLFFLWMLFFCLMRFGLLWRNFDLNDANSGLIFKSFLVGARFDMAITCYILFPLILFLLIPVYGWQHDNRLSRALPLILSLLWAPLIFLCLAEWEFYHEFHDRFNQLAIQYIKEDPKTVAKMIWYGYPVIKYITAWLALVIIMTYLLKRQLDFSRHATIFRWKRHIKKVAPAGMIMLILFFFGARGGFRSGPPLRWGDAFFSHNMFANHLALNGIFSLSRAIIEHKHNDITKFWLHKFSKKKALQATRDLVLQTGDKNIFDDEYPLLRYPGNTNRSLIFSPVPRHLVLIMMESLSGEFIGSMGSSFNATPNFDNLVKKGILFDRFFSQGTHTHQGVFATITSFPNLPGFEYLMQTNQGRQPFRSFLALLGEAGFQSVYVYNGSFTWDNQEGFFRNQGMKNFVGQNDYLNPIYEDPTWGVSDEDMFTRGIEEIRHLAAKGPSFAFLQTLSNHAPFDLPPPAPFPDLKGQEQIIPRLNGIRYSDWALGKFFDLARKEAWYKETLFVILGDHGFAYESPKAEMDLSCYHIPFLIYYPGDTTRSGQRIHTVGSQVDIMPTTLGLMGITGIYQSWGRDLFRLDQNDPGWAVIKPSGSGQMVGFIQDDRFMIVSPRMAPAVYHYKLNPWDAKRLEIPQKEMSALSMHLYGYVQSALDALLSSHAGFRKKPGTSMKIF